MIKERFDLIIKGSGVHEKEGVVCGVVTLEYHPRKGSNMIHHGKEFASLSRVHANKQIVNKQTNMFIYIPNMF